MPGHKNGRKRPCASSCRSPPAAAPTCCRASSARSWRSSGASRSSIDNRPGAAGNIGADGGYQAEPDGYTLLSAPPPPLVINRLLYPKLAYDSTQFVPMTVIAAIPNVLLVNPNVTRDGEGSIALRETAIPAN